MKGQRGAGATRAKRKDEQAARTSISMPPTIMAIGQQNMRIKSFGSFSDYIADLIRNDRGMMAPLAMR